MFLYRPEVYKIMIEPNGAYQGRDNSGMAELILAKQRNGPTGTVELVFLKDRTSFVSYQQDGYAPAEAQTSIDDDSPF